MTELERRVAFESIALRALWLILLFVSGGNPKTQAGHWRADAIGYLDLFGNQSPEAKEHRRGDHGFPPIYMP